MILSENNPESCQKSETGVVAVSEKVEASAETEDNKIYNETQKVTDAALTRSIIVSVFGILLCMVSLFSLTWAWYSSSVEVGSNRITAATFDLNVTVKRQDTEAVVEKNSEGVYVLDDPSLTYTVSLTKAGTAKTGFCQVAVSATADGALTPYYTGSVPQKDDAGMEKDYTFTVTGVARMKFTPMWGKYPADSEGLTVDCNGTLHLEVPDTGKSTQTPNVDTDNPEEETTSADTTAPEKDNTPVGDDTTEPIIPKETDPVDITTAVTEPVTEPEDTEEPVSEVTEAPAEETQTSEEIPAP